MIDVGLELRALINEVGEQSISVGGLRRRLVDRHGVIEDHSVALIHDSIRRGDIRLTDQFTLAMT